MTATEGFFSIKTIVSAEIVIKGSRFICHALPVTSLADAEKSVTDVATQYRDATHNCFALRVGQRDTAVFRFSDNGEPSGTAGRPILQAIEGRDLINVAAVVTRYFGGTKLGTGGLIRAYSAATFAALDKAAVVAFYPQSILVLRFSYELASPVHQMIAKSGVSILTSDFGEETTYRVQLKTVAKERFISELTDLTSAKVKIEIQDIDEDN